MAALKGYAMTFFRTALASLAPLALAACVTSSAEPRQVALETDLLIVRMSDGTVCYGPAPGGEGVTSWSGRLQDCAWTYAYTVEIDESSNPVRYFLQEVLDALGGGGLLSLIAEVTITSADGTTRVFQTPEREED